MCTTGTIMMWAGSIDDIPDGWLLCDGRLFDQSQYPDLYKAIGNNFGAAPPTGQFYLPDLRGRFVRGVDDSTGRDPDASARTDMQNPLLTSSAVGSIQSHAFQNHTHGYWQFGGAKGNLASGDYWKNAWEPTDEASASMYSVSTETRPVNAYLYFIISQ